MFSHVFSRPQCFLLVQGKSPKHFAFSCGPILPGGIQFGCSMTLVVLYFSQWLHSGSGRTEMLVVYITRCRKVSQFVFVSLFLAHFCSFESRNYSSQNAPERGREEREEKERKEGELCERVRA